MGVESSKSTRSTGLPRRSETLLIAEKYAVGGSPLTAKSISESGRKPERKLGSF